MGHPVSVLLVEDSADDAVLTLAAFGESTIAAEFVVAQDGDEALELLLGKDGNRGMEPHLILLDLQLPKVSGLELLRRIRAEDRTRIIPVVILSSSTEDSDITESYRLGANGYVRKSIDFLAFLDTARNLGRYWLHTNESPHGRRFH